MLATDSNACMHACIHTHTHTHTHAHTHACTHTCTHACTHTHTHMYIHISWKWDWRKGFHKEKAFQRTDRGSMMDRSRNRKWNLVKERAWTTVLCLEGWYSEHPCVWRRADLLGRNAKVKKVWKVDECLMRDDLKAKQRQFVFYPLLKKLTIEKNILTTPLLGIQPMTFLSWIQ